MSDVFADLAKDTAVRRAGLSAGAIVYRTTLPNSWDFLMPSGGVLMTAALRAMQAEVEPDKLLRSATIIFCTPCQPGPLTIEVHVLRSGRAASQVRARLFNDDSQDYGLECLATFAVDRTGFEVEGARFPDVPRRPDAEDVLDGHRNNPHTRFRFFQQLDARLAGPRLWDGNFDAGEAVWGRWFRYRTPQRTPDGFIDPLALPPLADTMPGAITAYLGPKGPRFYAPSLDLTLHVLEPTRSEWILVQSYCRRARAGYATCEVELWSEDERLVAYGTQTMILKAGSLK